MRFISSSENGGFEDVLNFRRLHHKRGILVDRIRVDAEAEKRPNVFESFLRGQRGELPRRAKLAKRLNVQLGQVAVAATRRTQSAGVPG
jgi:hypothetical protein